MPDSTPPSRLLRVVEPPLGLYFRPGRNDHKKLAEVLSMGPPRLTGAVMDASLAGRHAELRLELRQLGLEAVLDPMALELATKGGWERPALRRLKWAGEQQHEPRLLLENDHRFIEQLVEFIVANDYGAVISPTHYLKDGVHDAWWHADRHLTRMLRRRLDAVGKAAVPIYYRLALPRTALMDQRTDIIAGLGELDVDAVWLCLHPVNARRSGPNVLTSYMELCRDLATVGVPLVAERTGFLGTILLGFNAVGGIESGITLGESFDAGKLLKPRPVAPGKTAYSPGPRVYLQPLGIHLDRRDAQRFFDKPRTKSRFACQNMACCRSFEEMLADPRRHLLVARMGEVDGLSSVPAQNRPLIQLEALRRASDAAVQAAKIDQRLGKDRERLDGWRTALAGMAERGEHIRQRPAVPRGRIRHRRSA